MFLQLIVFLFHLRIISTSSAFSYGWYGRIAAKDYALFYNPSAFLPVLPGYQKHNKHDPLSPIALHIGDSLLFSHSGDKGRMHHHVAHFHQAQAHTILRCQKYIPLLPVHSGSGRCLQSLLKNHPHVFWQTDNYTKQFLHHRGVNRQLDLEQNELLLFYS